MGIPRDVCDSTNLNTSISVSLSDTDIGVSLYDSGLSATQRVEVVDFVIDVFYCEGDDVYTHTRYIGIGDVTYGMGKLLSVLEYFLHSQCS